MAAGNDILYEFGVFRLDPVRRMLLRDNRPVPITPKVFETLLILVLHSGEVVTKDDLMKELWPDAFVEESNLSQNIFMLRKALGDAPNDRRYIVTIPGRGYRLATEVRAVSPHGEQLIIASRTRSQVLVEQVDQVESETATVVETPAAIQRRRIRWAYLLSAAAIIGLLAAGVRIFLERRHHPVALSEKDSVLVADFTNTTGDPVFDDTLRQGLIVQLEQSPILNLVPEQHVRYAMQLMGREADARLTPELARDICERIAGAAVLDGSIASLGSRYIIGLRARDCHDGRVLDEEQAEAAGKEDVLAALSQIASSFRRRLGESLATVKEHDTPLAEATTPSLDALKAYSIGWKVMSSSGDEAALPFFQRAVVLDPEFAMAHASLGRVYGDLGEAAMSADSTSMAYRLRNRTSDPEKFWITAAYDMQVTENLPRAEQTCLVWEQTYPRDLTPHMFLAGAIYPVMGKYEQAVNEANHARELDPDFAIVYFILGDRYQRLGRLDQAASVLQQASARHLNLPDFLIVRFNLAFLNGDTAEMARTAALARRDPSANEWVTDIEAFTLAWSGRLRAAAETSQQAEQLALAAGHREAAALYGAGTAVLAGFFGDPHQAVRWADAALQLSTDRGVEYGTALAMALSGDSTRATRLADDLARRNPEDTSVQFSYLPTVRAQLALNAGEPAKAIELLEKAAQYELGLPRTALHANFGALYPIYIRGLSYLALHDPARAAAEFRKVLDHREIVVSDPIGVLSQLQIARAYSMAGDSAKARTSYQEFLDLWRNADPDILILKQARVEYAKLPNQAGSLSNRQGPLAEQRHRDKRASF